VCSPENRVSSPNGDEADHQPAERGLDHGTPVEHGGRRPHAVVRLDVQDPGHAADDAHRESRGERQEPQAGRAREHRVDRAAEQRVEDEVPDRRGREGRNDATVELQPGHRHRLGQEQAGRQGAAEDPGRERRQAADREQLARFVGQPEAGGHVRRDAADDRHERRLGTEARPSDEGQDGRADDTREIRRRLVVVAAQPVPGTGLRTALARHEAKDAAHDRATDRRDEEQEDRPGQAAPGE
jgi:hypothetical protein